jgi:hypothetical protein
MDSINLNQKNYRIREKRKNEGINRRNNTLVKKAYKLGEFKGVNVALIIYKYRRYIIYSSRDYKTWLLSMAEIVSEVIACLIGITRANTNLAKYISFAKEYIATRF